MAKGISWKIDNRIDNADEGAVFVTADFKDIANLATVRKCLGRKVEEGKIRRVFDGVYDKPMYSQILNEQLPVNPEMVAYALARSYHWTIAPCGDVALNKLGLSTQVPVVWSYISDGPYREFSWDNIKISFKHRANREISMMSPGTILVVEALKTLGKDHIDGEIIEKLRLKLPAEEKRTIMKEISGTCDWIYSILRKVCEE